MLNTFIWFECGLCVSGRKAYCEHFSTFIDHLNAKMNDINALFNSAVWFQYNQNNVLKTMIIIDKACFA